MTQMLDNLVMVLDIIIVLIFLICALRGKSQGFLESLVRLAAVSGGVIIGIMNTDRIRSLLFALPIDDFMKGKLTKKFNGQEMDLLQFIPKVLRTKFEAFGLDGINTTEKILRRGITFRSQFFQYLACIGAGFHQAERIMSLFCPIINLCQMPTCRKLPFIFHLI